MDRALQTSIFQKIRASLIIQGVNDRVLFAQNAQTGKWSFRTHGATQGQCVNILTAVEIAIAATKIKMDQDVEYSFNSFVTINNEIWRVGEFSTDLYLKV